MTAKSSSVKKSQKRLTFQSNAGIDRQSLADFLIQMGLIVCLGKDSPALGLHEEIRILEQSLQELRGRLATAHEARDRLENRKPKNRVAH